MLKILNDGKRIFTINDGRGEKHLAPHSEIEVKKEYALLLASSFVGEIKILEVAPIEPITEQKKGKVKK